MQEEAMMMEDTTTTTNNDDVSMDPLNNVSEIMFDMASKDPGIANFIHRWLSALNDVFPEQNQTWTLLNNDMESVAQYCVLHYSQLSSCLSQEQDERGALIVTQENNEFLPGLSAHDLFNQNHVSRLTRQSMVSYTQCMYSLVGQWSGETIAAEYEAAAAASSSSSIPNNMNDNIKHPDANRHSIARYADLFNYLLERSIKHESIDTGIPAINAFLTTATGQWITVLIVRQFCSVHTDVLCELCQFIEQRLHVNIGDSSIWTEQLLPILFRKIMGLVQSTVRRTEAWNWFENWFKWFGPGSPVAFVSRIEYQQNGGRGILYPDTFVTDVRMVLVSETAKEALTKMHLSQVEIVDTFDRVVDAWSRNDETSAVSILTQFVEMPSIRTAFQRWAHDLGMPKEFIQAMGGNGEIPSQYYEHSYHQQQQYGGRKNQRDATIARCRQRAYESSLNKTCIFHNNNVSLVPPSTNVPIEDTRSIDELMAFIGTEPVQKKKSKAKRKY